MFEAADGILRFFVAGGFFYASLLFWLAFRREKRGTFSGMRIYAMLLTLAWGMWELYLAHLLTFGNGDVPGLVSGGTITLGLLFPTVAYFTLSAIVTTRVVKDLLPLEEEEE